jgi:hypothetical protein
LQSYESVLYGIAIEYYLTKQDVVELRLGQPIEATLAAIRHYRIEHTELRFFRHARRMQWLMCDYWPRQLGPVAKERILYRHYKYRTPEQIQVRMRARMIASRDHWWPAAYAGKDWRDLLPDGASLKLDDGQPFDTSAVPNHRGSMPRELAKRVLSWWIDPR